MSFFDNIQAQASTWLTNYGPDLIQSGLQSTGLIKVAAPPTSNLTAAQVGQGATGTISGFGGQSSSAMPGWLIPVLALAGVLIAVFAFKKGK